MKQYLHIIQNTFPIFQEEDLLIPIKEIDIDSLDILVIRVSLEKHFDIEIPDSIWYSYQTLFEVLEYFHNNKKKERIKFNPNETSSINYSEPIEIRMPQMANSSLSENWLLKYLGDTHWNLLSRGFKKKSSDFKDENGNRLYATFIRINYTISALHNFKENEIIDFNCKIEGFGNNTFISQVDGYCEENTIKASLLTTFSIRDNSNNNKISKGNIDVIPNIINQLSNTPLLLNDYRLLQKGLLEEISTDFGSFPNSNEVIFSWDYEINPYYEINGVGLFYFAAYAIVSDSCLLKYFKNSELLSYSTIYRDIFYFANCNTSDKINFQLNFIEIKDDKMKTMTSLYRQSDNKLLAKILTVKKKICS